MSTTNTEVSISNSDLYLKKGSIIAKFTYVKKKMYRNAVVEVEADTRKTLVHRKIKLRWQICRIEDYLLATSRLKCSKFNHRTQECRGEVTCPVRRPSHTKSAKETQRHSIVPTVQTTINNRPRLSATHSSLDRKCPSLLGVLEKNRLNTEY